MRQLKKSTARDILVFIKDSLDHVSGKTGLTLTITASKNAAAFASITPTVLERVGGWYRISLTASHTDTLGDFSLNITGSGADLYTETMQVVTDFSVDYMILASGTVQDLAATTTSFKTSLTAPNYAYNDSIIKWTSGANVGINTPLILTSEQTDGRVTLSEATLFAPTNGDTFDIIFGHVHPVTQIAQAVQTTQMTEGYAVVGVAPTLAQAVFAILQRLMNFTIIGNTITVKELDGTSTAYTLTTNSTTNPTSSNRAT